MFGVNSDRLASMSEPSGDDDASETAISLVLNLGWVRCVAIRGMLFVHGATIGDVRKTIRAFRDSYNSFQIDIEGDAESLRLEDPVSIRKFLSTRES